MNDAAATPPARSVLVYDRIEANRRRTAVLLALFAVLMAPAIFWLYRFFHTLTMSDVRARLSAAPGTHVTGGPAFDREAALSVAVAIGIALVFTLIEYRFAAARVLRRSGARLVSREQEPLLWRTVENLCIGAGLPKPRLYVVESPAVNAFATGLDPDNAALVVTRGLLRLMDRRELEGVIAHELAHIGNHDIRVSTVAAALAHTLTLPLRFHASPFNRRAHQAAEQPPTPGLLVALAVVPLLAVVGFILYTWTDVLGRYEMALEQLGPILLVLCVVDIAPGAGWLLRMAVSREREYLADADAALVTGYPAGLARALAKIEGHEGGHTLAAGTDAHLYIADPRPSIEGWWDSLATHPPLAQRISLLSAMDTSLTPAELAESRRSGAAYAFAEQLPALPVSSGTVTGERVAGFTDPVIHPTDFIRLDTAKDAAPQASAGYWNGTGRSTPSDVGTPHRALMLVDAYRLGAPGAPLYNSPDASTAARAQLDAGAVVTVLDVENGFARVLTADDTWGYLPVGTPLTPINSTDIDTASPAA